VKQLQGFKLTFKSLKLPIVNVLVRNVVRGETYYVDSTNAVSGDEVEFKITLTNNGEDAATCVSVTNPIPTGLLFSSGSASATVGV
jgi:uncharacterized repeat protein (TIGR01451 family)